MCCAFSLDEEPCQKEVTGYSNSSKTHLPKNVDEICRESFDALAQHLPSPAGKQHARNVELVQMRLVPQS